jgi:hypothetical protein
MQSPQYLRKVRPNLDWKSLRLLGESELESALASLPTASAGDEELAGGMLANAEVSPALFRASQIVREVLGLPAALELYIVPSESWRTGLLADGDEGTIRLAITSSVAARLHAKEATFVLGRLVGRRLLGCRQLPTRTNPMYDPAALLVRGVQRFQDLAADRVGLLCCQDVHVAAKAIVRLTSGLPDELLDIDLPGLLRQRPDEAETLAHGDEHAFCLMRLAAAAIFHSSDKYSQAFASEPIEEAASVYELAPPPIDENAEMPFFETPLVESESAAPVKTPAIAAVAAQPATPPAEPSSETLMDDPVASVLELPTRHEPPIATPAPVASPPEPVVKVLRPVEGVEGLLEEVYLPLLMASAEPPPTALSHAAAPMTAGSTSPAHGDAAAPTAGHVPLNSSATGQQAAIGRHSTTGPEWTPAQPPTHQEKSEFATAPAQEETISPATAARRFTWWSGRRLGSLNDGDDFTRRSALEKFGFTEWTGARWPADAEECDAECRRAAAVLRNEPLDLRLGIMRDVLSIAAAGGTMTEAADEAARQFAQALGIGVDDWTSLRSEYVDPEFADYAFSRGQAVQVRWDGAWVPGVVRDLEPDGDLRVHFAEENVLLRLSPRADLIRPSAARRVI